MESMIGKLLQPEIIWVLIPLVAIIGLFARQLVQRYFSHKERMAKIEAGMDPDAPLGGDAERSNG